ncbi:hypothetical protein BC332_21161 [Capsicum chinense]|nr:hypothetical protein BC332_21161 [Capsicum chinense]
MKATTRKHCLYCLAWQPALPAAAAPVVAVKEIAAAEMTACFQWMPMPSPSDIGSLDISTPDKMNDASDVGCETSNEKKLVENEDNMATEAEAKKLEVALERFQ